MYIPWVFGQQFLFQLPGLQAAGERDDLKKITGDTGKWWTNYGEMVGFPHLCQFLGGYTSIYGAWSRIMFGDIMMTVNDHNHPNFT